MTIPRIRAQAIVVIATLPIAIILSVLAAAASIVYYIIQPYGEQTILAVANLFYAFAFIIPALITLLWQPSIALFSGIFFGVCGIIAQGWTTTLRIQGRI